MKKRLYVRLLMFIFFAFLSVNLSAQPNDDDSNSSKKFKFKRIMSEYYKKYNIDTARPVIELNYGLSTPHWNGMSKDFKQLGTIDAKIGVFHSGELENSSNVVRSNFGYIYIQNSSLDLGSKSDDEYYSTDLWNFGLADENGYGWKLGDKGMLLLYHANGINWTKTQFNTPGNNAADADRIDYLGNDIRFGNQFESGVRVRFIDNLALTAAYSRNVIYPRHLFWYWAGSELTEFAAQGVAGAFVKFVEKSAPEFVPIVNFALHSAISYGIYELRRDNMNWPIGTESPFEFQTFKLGITVIM